MLRCQNVCFSYIKDTPILQNVNLHLAEGSFTFLSGPSGAGKSSLLSLLSLQLKPDAGDITLMGREASKLPHNQLPVLRRRIGTVFQDFQLLDHLTVSENVALPLKVSGEHATQIRKKTDELLHWVGLDAHHNIYPPYLSGGEKQRVAIARAIINNPLILLADEPTGNLDPELSMRFMYLFEALNNNGTTILFATHDEKLINNFNYPALYLHNGKLQRGQRP